MKSFYVTTPIYYVNAAPHLGHAYTTILTDCYTKFHKIIGEDSVFITGTDEHGDKIVQSAEKNGQNIKDFTDNISNTFKVLWEKMDIHPYKFIRTTDENHKKIVQNFLQKVYDNGDIYYGDYGGYYCYGCERFYTEKELLPDGTCPQHLVKAEYISEKNYFFKMSKYQNWLIDHIKNNPDFIRPEQYYQEALALLESGELEDLCISRPKSRLTWGIELPFDSNYVCYVWFDALLSYFSAIDGPYSDDWNKYWQNSEHIIAKDILKPHAIFWPTMLKSANIPLFKHLNVHGYWLVRETKMSKSLGNVIDPFAMSNNYGQDVFRYFLMREMHFGSDASFSDDAIILRNNSDLANDLGNLYSRVLSMTAKYFNSIVPSYGKDQEEELELKKLAALSFNGYQSLFYNLKTSQALESLWTLVRALNKYVDSTAPWTLAKNNNLERLGTVLYTLLEYLRKIAIHLWPVMPKKSEEMLAQLGIVFSIENINLTEEIDSFGKLMPNTKIAESSNIFPRINVEKKEEEVISEPISNSETISFEDFKKLDLRLGTVVLAEKHPNADKLLRLLVDIGEKEPRQILAGLAEYFSLEDIMGKQVCILANLAPRKMRGLESQGMLLAIKTDNGMELVTSTNNVKNGSKVS